MLAFFGSKLGAYLIASLVLTGVIGGVLLHLRAQASTIAALHEQVTLLAVQTKTLQVANEAMRVDMDNVQQAQANANRAIDDVRGQAASAVKVVNNRTFAVGTPTAIQIQINKEMSDSFARLEASTRAK